MVNKIELEQRITELEMRLNQARERNEREVRKSAAANVALDALRQKHSAMDLLYRIALLKLANGAANSVQLETATEKLRLIEEVLSA